MKSKITIIKGIVNYEDFVIQFFFITPRFRYVLGSKLYLNLNKIISKMYLGDNLTNIEYQEDLETKYKMGILKIIIYEKKQKIKFIEEIKKLIIEFEKGNTIGCSSCQYYDKKKRHCFIWDTKIYNETKNKCDFWEEE